MRNTISVLIYLFAAVMFSSLLLGHILPDWRSSRACPVDPEILAMQWRDLQEWNHLRRGDEIIGGTRLMLTKNFKKMADPPTNRDYELVQNMDVALRLPLLPTVIPVQAHLTAGLSREFHVREFLIKASVQKMTLQAEGFIQKDTLYYRINQGKDEPMYGLIRLKAPLSLLPAVEPLVTRYFDLKVGKSYTIPLADPLNGGNALEAKVRIVSKEEIDMDGEEVPAFRIETKVGELTKTRWVDDKGATLRAEIFQNILSEKASVLEMQKRYPSLKQQEPLPDFDTVSFKQRAVAVAAQQKDGPQLPGGGAITPQIIQQVLTPLLKGI